MPPTVPQAVQSCHELLLWLVPQLDKFPRAHAAIFWHELFSKRFGDVSQSMRGWST